jgi:hypothetical protein
VLRVRLVISRSPAGSFPFFPFFPAIPALRVACLKVACLVGACVAVACLTTGCTGPVGSSATAATVRAAGSPDASGSGTGSGTGSPLASPSVKPSPKPKPKPTVKFATVRTRDGSVLTVAAFLGPVTYVLHNGATDPGWAASSKGVHAGPAIGPTERRRVLAAFNGGFKLVAAAGGYEQEGKIVSPLLKGYASLIIDKSGQAHIGDWGYGVPGHGEQVYSVRQNLGPLVSQGKPAVMAPAWRNWGGTVNGLEYVARSAIGENAAGDLIYVASMSTVPADLAYALVKAGARIGMELDINPNWVQLDVAGHPGGTLRAAIPGQWRPADQFVVGWDRDFFTVLAAP